MEYRILVINPGSTSTKLALYEKQGLIVQENITHSPGELEVFDDILQQEEYRSKLVKKTLSQWQVSPEALTSVVARGGLLPNMKGGGYLVTPAMLEAIRSGKASPHASNLGALLAWSIAEPIGIPAYIYDSVTSDEFTDLAKITGMPDVSRQSMCHVLNMKAVSRKVAAEYGRPYEEMKLIVAHLGGGVSISVHEDGKIVDAIRDDAGPFSPERAGGVPLLYVIDMCYCGRYSKNDMLKRVRGMGGMKAYLGTPDCREIEARIQRGDEKAELIYQAQAYQISKGIGEMAPVVSGRLDCVILTGGMAHSKLMTDMIRERVEFIAPVKILPGEFEMEALAMGAVRILQGEPVRQYGEL